MHMTYIILYKHTLESLITGLNLSDYDTFDKTSETYDRSLKTYVCEFQTYACRLIVHLACHSSAPEGITEVI